MLRAARDRADSSRDESVSERLVREAAESVTPDVPEPIGEARASTTGTRRDDLERAEELVFTDDEVRVEATVNRPAPPRPPAGRPVESRSLPPRPVESRPAPPRPVRRPVPPDRTKPPSPRPVDAKRRGAGWLWIVLIFTIGPMLMSLLDRSDDTVDDSGPSPVTFVLPGPQSGNPFPGVWAAEDVDGSRIALIINDDGTFEMFDTSAAPCRSRGLDRWQWNGRGEVAGGEQPTFEASGGSVCLDGADVVSASAQVTTGVFAYNSNGTMTFVADGTCYYRISDGDGTACS
jgi:hypothetical protein